MSDKKEEKGYYTTVWLCRVCHTENDASLHYCKGCNVEITIGCKEVYSYVNDEEYFLPPE